MADNPRTSALRTSGKAPPIPAGKAADAKLQDAPIDGFSLDQFIAIPNIPARDDPDAPKSLKTHLDGLFNSDLYKGADAEVQDLLRTQLIHDAKFERDKDIASRTQDQKDRQKGRSSLATGIESVGLGLVMQATAGQLPNVVGVVLGAPAEEEMRRNYEAFQATNPAATGAGEFGGFFVGPLAKGMSGAAKGAGWLIGHGAAKAGQKLPKAEEFVTTALEGHMAARWARFTAENMAGGAAALSAYRFLEDDDGDNILADNGIETRGLGISARLDKLTQDLSSGLFIGMTAAGGALQTALTQNVNKALLPLINAFEKETGLKVPIAVFTDNVAFKSWMDTVSHTPGLKTQANQVREDMLRGLKTVADNMVARNEGAKAGGAGRAARRIQGTSERPGLITQTRRETNQAALEAEGSGPLPDSLVVGIREGLRHIVSSRSRTEVAEGPGLWQQIVNQTLKATKPIKPRRDIRVVGARGRAQRGSREGELTEFAGQKFQTVRASDFASLLRQATKSAYSHGRDPQLAAQSATDVREARQFVHLLNELATEYTPKYRGALDIGAKLRKMEEAFNFEAIPQIDDASARAFFGMRDVLPRLNALKNYATPEDRGALKGWYMMELLKRTYNSETGFIDPKRLEAQFARTGMFNRQIMDEVLPGMRRELMDASKLSRKFRESVLSAAGSPTFGRSAVAGATVGLASAAIALIMNGYSPLSGILTTAGVGYIVRSLNKSVLQGHQAVEGALYQASSRVLQAPGRAPRRAPLGLGGSIDRRTREAAAGVQNVNTGRSSAAVTVAGQDSSTQQNIVQPSQEAIDAVLKQMLP